MSSKRFDCSSLRIGSIFLYLILLGCNNSLPLKGTKWVVIGIAVDSANSYNEDDRSMLLNFSPAKGLYSYYKDSILINYLNKNIQTTKYRQEGNSIIFFEEGYENDTTKILKHTRDTLLIKSANGAIIKMVRIEDIPK